MVKFIIEVEDEYINEFADIDKFKENVSDDAKGTEVVHKLLSAVTFTKLKEDIDKGQREFVINLNNVNKNARRLFDNAVDMAATLHVIKN